MEKKTAKELYGGDIQRLTEEGYSCDQIGQKLGICRQRVWQLLKKFYPDIKPRWPNDVQAAEIFGVSVSALRDLRKRGLIHPLKVGKFYRYHLEAQSEIKSIIRRINRPCRICGGPIPPGHKTLCLKCSLLINDPKLRLTLPGEREKHNRAMRKWKRTHSEEFKPKNRKNCTNYQLKLSKKNYETSEYEVIASYPQFTLGERFKAVGYKDHLLILADGRTIPTLKIRKMKGLKERPSLQKYEKLEISEGK